MAGSGLVATMTPKNAGHDKQNVVNTLPKRHEMPVYFGLNYHFAVAASHIPP
jgi:hypothetical protein